MAWFCPSPIDCTLWADRGNANPRYRVGALASPALYNRRNAAIWSRPSTFRSFVDGVVNGVAAVVKGFGGLLRHVQTGYVHNYAFTMAFGVVVIVAFYLFR